MSRDGRPGQDLSWLLDDLGRPGRAFPAGRVPVPGRAAHRRLQDLSREDAEHLSALAAGVQSLARGAGEHFGVGEVRQTIIELEQAFLFVTAAGHGSCLAVLCPSSADAGLIAYEMAMLVKRAGPHLAASPVPGRQSPGGVSTTCPQDGKWVDQDAGPVVRPYALTGGRTRPAEGMVLDLIAVIVAAGRAAGPATGGLSPPSTQDPRTVPAAGHRGRRGVRPPRCRSVWSGCCSPT